MSMIRLAIIGIGYWGSKIANTCDTINEITTLRYDINDDWKSCNYDCAIVATPAETHFEIASYLLNKHIPTMVEKPVGIDLDEVKSLCDLAHKQNTILQTGHILLFTKSTEYILENINANDIKLVETRRCAAGSIPKHQISLSHHLLIHDLALMDYFSAGSIQDLQAGSSDIISTPNPDYENFTIKWDKFTSNHTVSWYYPGKVRNVVVCTEHDLISVDDVSNTVHHTIGSYNGKLEVQDPKEFKLLDSATPLRREIENFVNSVHTGNKNSRNNTDHITRVYSNLELILKHV